MIEDHQTNTVYFSNLLFDPPEQEITEAPYIGTLQREYQQITSILNKHQIKHDLLNNAKDIWCRDYMPVQVAKNKFVRFRFDPDYLKGKECDDIRTESSEVTFKDFDPLKGSEIIDSELIIDGGNIIRGDKRAILSEKIYVDNQDKKPEEIIECLKHQLDVDEVIMIPYIKSDMTGHADGLIRFIDDDTVLVSEVKNLKYYNEELDKVIKRHNLERIDIPDLWDDLKYNGKSANGNYINYLQVGNLVILPTYGVPEDEDVVKKFEESFTGHAIETAGASRLARFGGVFNCISWNVEV